MTGMPKIYTSLSETNVVLAGNRPRIVGRTTASSQLRAPGPDPRGTTGDRFAGSGGNARRVTEDGGITPRGRAPTGYRPATGVAGTGCGYSTGMSTTSRNPDDSNPDFTPSQRRGVVPGPPSGATGGDAADLHPDLARRKGIRRTRTGALWTALVTGVLILLLLLVFILQNLDSITLELFGWDFSLPLGVALLFAAIAGAAIVGIAGGLRILQLRHAANRQRALSTDPGARP